MTTTTSTTSPRADSIGSAIGRRFHGQPAWAAVTEVFIGLGWIRAGVAKLVDGSWWSGDDILQTLQGHADLTLDWYRPFLDHIVVPFAPLVAFAVLVAQLIAGGLLLSGTRRGLGLAIGMLLNVHFVAAGIVDPSAFYLVAQGALVLWRVEARLGGRPARVLLLTAAAGVAIVGFNLPFVRTVDPAQVIDDPALMFVTLGALTTLGAALVGRER